MLSKAEQYIEDVLKRKIVTGIDIKNAYQRHKDDLKTSKKSNFKYFFSPTHAQMAIDAFEMQRLAFGDMTDEPFILMPWQAAIIWQLYGWRRKKDGLRRFQKMYLKVARGNAKTEFLAGIGNLAFFFESEKDPQVFWAATVKKQAKIGFGRQKTMAERMMRDYPEIAAITKIYTDRIIQTDGVGFVSYLGKDSKTEDGFSPLYALIDEWHEHPNDSVVHVMESGMVKRRSPMTCIITTAGTNPDCPCAEFEKRAKAMLSGSYRNDELLALIYDLDEHDDWHDKRVWPKPNPGLGISLHMSSLESEYNKALTEGINKENNFKTKNLNIWVRGKKQWISDQKFKAAGSKFAPAILEGRLCFGGIDLSKNRDITALALFFPARSEDEQHYALFTFYCPEDNAKERDRLDAIPYLQWAKDGWLTITPGDVVDYDYMKAKVLDCYEKYELHSIAYDRHRAIAMVKDIQDEIGNGHKTQTGEFLEGFAQTIASFSAPCTEMEKMILVKKLNHGGNPVLEWMNRNVVTISDTNGNFKMDRGKSSEKIDGMVALAMAIGQWMTYRHTITEQYSPDSDVVVI